MIAEARRQGAVTLAISNFPHSDLAEAADHVIHLHAGPEKAVAATKTYTGQAGGHRPAQRRRGR